MAVGAGVRSAGGSVGKAVGGTVAGGAAVAVTIAGTVVDVAKATAGATVTVEVGVFSGTRVEAGTALAWLPAQIWSSDITGGATLLPHAHPSTAPSETWYMLAPRLEYLDRKSVV